MADDKLDRVQAALVAAFENDELHSKYRSSYVDADEPTRAVIDGYFNLREVAKAVLVALQGDRP